MRQAISFITIGVRDLDMMKNFYREKFKWTPIKDSDGIVFFKVNGFIFALFPEEELAKDIGISNNGEGFKRMAFAINFRSEKEVDDVFNDLEQKGVKIIKRPGKVFWGGYSGYIADVEDNYWEFAFNPFLELDANGNVAAHQ
ncbi:MAG: VOC family protein [Bacteroidetes bacterium]|nr:VOC family protein [Bacteroidota bacterium]